MNDPQNQVLFGFRVGAHLHISPGSFCLEAENQLRLTHEVAEAGRVLRHEVVDDGAPVGESAGLHLEDQRIQQQVDSVLAPGLPRILEPAQAGQQLRAGVETGRVTLPVMT